MLAFIQEVQKRNMKQLLSMQNVTSLLDSTCTQVTTSQAVDTATSQSVQHYSGAGTAAGEMSFESSMTDDDSSRADAPRPQRQRRHRGADDVFPTHALQRYQVLLLSHCTSLVLLSQTLASLFRISNSISPTY